MTAWDDVINAKKYDEYAKTFPTYKDTSYDLVRSAEIEADMSIIDLACGTGMTSQVILETLNGTGHLYSIDMSQAMLDIARENLNGNNVSFHLSQAENLHNVINELVDRVVCNSAFWQIKPNQTLQAIHKTLKKTGILAYNLPRPFYDFKDLDSGTGQAGNFAKQMRQVAITDFGITLPSITAARKNYFPPTLDDIRHLLQDNGFTLIAHKIITYTQSFEATGEFCAIPVMTEQILPGVDYPTRMAILEKVRSSLTPDIELNMPWLFLTAKITA